MSLLGLESIANDFGHLLGEIVGGPQVLSHEAHFPLNVAIHDCLTSVVCDPDLQGQRGSSHDRGHFAFFLAALGEGLRRGAQCDEVGSICRILVAATINMLKLARLLDLHDQVFVDGNTEIRRDGRVPRIRGLDLDGRGRDPLCTLGITCARLHHEIPDHQKEGAEADGDAANNRDYRPSVVLQCLVLLFVGGCIFCKRMAGFRAHRDELLLERSSLALRQHQDSAMVAAVGIFEFHRENINLV